MITLKEAFAALEERMHQHDLEIAALQTDLSGVQESFREVREVSALVTASAFSHSSVPTQKSATSMKAKSMEAQLERVGRLEAEVSALRTATVGENRSDADNLSDALRKVREMAEGVQRKAESTEAEILPLVAARAGWNSAIVPDFPRLFEDFRKQKFTLLWRGSRDGFGAKEFHNRCNGHPNTLTVILDTIGNIFGGFTPVEWDCQHALGKADPSLKSFLFTLKNPHNFPARRFALKAARKDMAIGCNTVWGPSFCDIGASENCNRTTRSATEYLGNVYTNDTGLDGRTFFTGSPNFQVKEIEVFEISA
jgi:hypothetical protein